MPPRYQIRVTATTSTTLWSWACLALLVVLVAGIGWILFSLDSSGASREAEIERIRLTAAFALALVAAILLIVHQFRARERPEPPAQEAVTPWWTEPFGDASFDGVFTVDGKGLVRSSNDGFHKMFGYSADETRGQSLLRFVSGGAALVDSEGLRRRASEGISVQIDGRRKDGSSFPIELRLTKPRQDSARRVYLGVCRERSSAREVEGTAAPVDPTLSLREKCIARIGRSINSQLTGIFGYVDMAREAVREEDSVRTDLDEIWSAAGESARLVRLLQLVSRKPPAPAETVDLHRLLIPFQEAIAERAGIRSYLVTEFEHGRALIYAHRAHLVAFFNSLASSLDSSRMQGAELTIRTGPQPAAPAALVELAGLELVDDGFALDLLQVVLVNGGGTIEAEARPDGKLALRCSFPSVPPE